MIFFFPTAKDPVDPSPPALHRLDPLAEFFSYIRPAGVLFSVDFRLAAFFPHFFPADFRSAIYFSANPAEIRRLRPATTTKGYYTTKTPCSLVGHIRRTPIPLILISP